jgi:hypothetical protein
MAQIILDSNNNLIQGDFDNATLNNRTKLQTTTTNATTNVYVVPNGSSTSAGVSVANNSSLTNASKIVMATNGTTDTQIISGVNGSGSYLPMSFYTNNTLAMQITTAGNILVASTAAPAFNAYISSNQSLTSGVTTKIALNAEFFDTANCFDSTTNYRFTPNVAGYYQLNLPLLAYSSASNITSVAVFLYKNGSSITYQQTLLPATILASACLSTVVFANGTTDYFEMYANVAGTGIFVSGGTGGSVTTTFSGAFVRSA